MSSAQRQFATRSLVERLGSWFPRYAHTVAGVLIALGLLLGTRRLLIGQVAPLPIWTTLATAVILLLLVYAIRRVAAGQLFFPWLPTVVLATWAIVGSYPGSQPQAWVIWLGAIALDFAVARYQESSKQVVQASSDRAESNSPGRSTSTSTDTSVEPTDDQSAVQSDGEVVLQHVVRVRDANGSEHVHATLRGEFAAGERRTTLYVGFCPPLAGVPQVEAEVIEGPPGMAKVIQSLHNGVQVEVDLHEASLEDSNVTVEVAAYQA